MNKKVKIAVLAAAIFTLLLLLVGYLHNTTVAVFDPKGTIAAKERNLIMLALGLSLIVVIPVFILLFSIAWRYREGNKKAKYSPELDHNIFAETLWWLIPGAIILVLSVVTWNSSHELDPYRSLNGSQPLTIQVVALDWKWLFIYPQQGVASVNRVEIPVNTPINFQITSDTVMNSFWIPQLGGQIYAMPGMATELHLMASSPGDYRGSSANISGSGFASMDFDAQATSQHNFQAWLNTARQSSQPLNVTTYNELAVTSQNHLVTYYSSTTDGLYASIIMKYMAPLTAEGGTL